jgi:hypothetical protein
MALGVEMVLVRAAFVLFLLLLASGVHAEKRVALVIGNGAYGKVSQLPNPTRDAEAIESLLRSANFDLVVAQRDLGNLAMRRSLRDFSDRVRDADIAVLFYAGHGIEVNGANYLIPVDAILERDIDVEDEAIPVDRVIQILEPAKRLRLVILDACRDNPFIHSMKRTISGRSIGRGLAKVDVLTSDTLIAFAAKAGSTALDGDGANSPYTRALLKHLTTPGLDLRLALGRVRDEVLKDTDNKQEPFVYGSLGGNEVVLVPAKALPEVGSTSAPRVAVDYDKEMEIAFWNAVKDSNSADLLQTYVDRYPAGNFVALAKALIEEIRKKQNVTRADGHADSKAGAKPEEKVAIASPSRDVGAEPSRIRLSGHASWSETNCAGRGLPRISISSSPKNGRVEFTTERFSVKVVAPGRSGKCIGTTQTHRVLYYVSVGTPAASDHVSYLVHHERHTVRVECSVDPIANTSQCKRQ